MRLWRSGHNWPVTCLEHMTCPYGLSMKKCCSSREVTQHAAGGNFPYDSRWRYWTTRRRHPAMDRRSGSGHAHVERRVFGDWRMMRGVGPRRVARRRPPDTSVDVDAEALQFAVQR